MTAPAGQPGDVDTEQDDDQDDLFGWNFDGPLPEGWWACPHHGEGGGPDDRCRGCSEYWGE
ncbi:hypothetical protein ACGF07_34625 [Kitasatospora sp. NPDC048194]|uniref:hypothetical protein n=1 Tax=Kitasatospora sp. NPDC048194 TaxID=3364045 RepID=UPI0037166D71